MREYTKRAGGKSVTSRFEQSHVRLCFFMAKVYLFVQGPRSLLLPTAVWYTWAPFCSLWFPSMVSSALPTEILASVFGLLPPSNLALASRVCREWKKVAFQPLYHTVYLCLAVHLEQLAQRILTEDAASPTSVSAHLKGLAFDIKYMDEREEEMISEADIAHINAIIPHLAHLQSLSWNLMFVPQDPGTFQLFQIRCPKLTSVHIWIQDDIDFYASGFDTEQLEPLTSLLTRSPNISSLVLDLVSTDGESYYSPTALVSALGENRVLPRLRRFHVHGHQDPNWTTFFEKPDSHPLRQFLIRHPGIEDIGFGLFEETEYGDVIDPAQVARLFPSLKHFEGPAFLFQPLVQSTLGIFR
ncbi:F-box-like domain-containing protein [Rhizoctonia solani AG-1 IA]|uniref:F-box-like domain-containing protein n=1 Tax=Thanatephorus cucumeris (strain AG1-IA) TaxID=983506 RepID=L8WIG2_THACA|nr:F-box-like domain-containing protein [Rhizoctonia solani AG-1 IA]